MTNEFGTTSRRTFLKATAATSLLPALTGFAEEKAAPAWPENGTLIPDNGWSLWVDSAAAWKNDTIYLPEDLPALATLPVNAPTGGWDALAGIPVTLPSTVEQHYWGKYGSRSYTPEEYRYAADDPIPQNGAYFGVSWWHRAIDIPASMQGKRIFLHVRGARLRAEVYLNRKLVGYSIMEELPFECDLTNAANPGGKNELAIRITNPFGRFDWVDGTNAQWGSVRLYRSHGFGGLDRGMTISAHAGDRIAAAWVLNGPEGSLQFHYQIEQFSSAHMPGMNGRLKVEIVDARSGVVVATTAESLSVGINERDRSEGPYRAMLIQPASVEFGRDATLALWDLAAPRLYHARFIWNGFEHSDTRVVVFGVRDFAPAGLGTNAMFRLNGRRMKLYSSISWGFWGLNGIWPTPELAVKEVTQAKKLGLNCLNFHRNLAKEDVLRAHDTLGLLRYLEPGGGKLAIGKLPDGVQANAANIVMEKPISAADKFAQRYMFVKCVEMVKAFRSHPSVIVYCLQNEIGADLKNPDTLAVLAAMRAEDPSRCIVLNDGFVAPPRKAAQAWYAPWDNHLHRSDEEEWGGWWNQHQGAGDQWYDEFYKSPTDFTYKAPWKKVLTEFGEMEGCATPDNHSLMLHQQAAMGVSSIGAGQPANKSYDHVDHAEILAAYDKWLDRWGFRKAFPATESLWSSLGKKCYDTWQNYLENARISDELDFAVISGWESTAIENHSGVVDNLRNFKSDPAPIAGTLLPVRPVAKQRSVCNALSQPATFDLYLLNDTSDPVTGTLDFTAVSPSGKLLKLGSFHVPAQTADVFSYLVKEAFVTPALDETGLWRFRFALTSAPANMQTKEIWVTGVPLRELAGKAARIAVSGISPSLRKQLEALGPNYTVRDFRLGEQYELIISSGVTSKVSTKQESGDTTGLEAQPGEPKPVPSRKLEPGEAAEPPQTGHLQQGILEAVRAGTPLLAIPQADALSDGVAKQLADAGAFTWSGNVGDLRAPWMGDWYFVREHPLYAGMPTNQAMGIHYAAKGRQSNGLVVDGLSIEIVAGYSRDHDRRIGAGTFTCKLGAGKIVYHRVPELHPILQARFLANAISWLVSG